MVPFSNRTLQIFIPFLLAISFACFAAEVLPPDIKISNAEQGTDNSSLGFAVIGHVPQVNAYMVAVDENRQLAFVANLTTSQMQPGIRIFDISAPQMPQELATYLFDSSGGEYPVQIIVNEASKRLYVLTNSVLQIVDVNDEKHPKPIGHYDVDRDAFQIAGLSKDGNKLYLLGYKSIAIIDIQNPSTPKLLRQKNLSERILSGVFAPATDTVFIVGINALHAVNVKNPRKLHVTSSLSTLPGYESYDLRQPIVATEDGKNVLFACYNRDTPDSSGVAVAQLDAQGKLSFVDGAYLELGNVIGGPVDPQFREHSRRLYLMTVRDGITEIDVTSDFKLKVIRYIRVPMIGNYMGSLSSQAFYVTNDQKMIFQITQAREDEAIVKFGGLNIFRRK